MLGDRQSMQQNIRFGAGKRVRTMKYKRVVSGVFLERPNRFIANVLIDGREETVHVKNTGRCRELLVLGAPVYLEEFRGIADLRKTRYDLIAVRKKSRNDSVLINVDSQAPNKVAEEALRQGLVLLPGFATPPQLLRREVVYGDSRFDLYAEGPAVQQDEGRQCEIPLAKKVYIEVKGVTLERNGVALFPDAPTQRGVKHIRELIRAKKAGYEAVILFVVQLEQVKCFRPNDQAHPEFGQALREAQEAGVAVLAYSCAVERDSLHLLHSVPVQLVPSAEIPFFSI